jgi:predicted amidohydrolase
MVMATIRIAQCQLPVPADKSETLALVERTVREAVSRKADMVTLPEMFCCPYRTENFPLYAEEEGGRVWEACSELARQYGITLSAGSMPERDESGKIYNTAYVFDRWGRQIAKHRKMHLFDIDVKGGQRFRESETLSAGNSVTTFETEFGTFGLCVCYDFRFPELGRLMALRGAQVILVPAAFNMTTGPAHWETMFRSQALNNQVFAVGTAPAREEGASYTSWGHSIVADPWGQVASQMDEKQGVRVTELDLDRVREVREQLPLLRHRRTDVYSLEAKAD